MTDIELKREARRKDMLESKISRIIPVVALPMVITMLGIFIFTSGRDGAVSRALSIKPLTWLSTLDAEIYLLQLGLNFALFPLFEACGITQYPILHFTMQFSSLIFVSWLVHHYYTRPIARLLTASQPDKGN